MAKLNQVIAGVTISAKTEGIPQAKQQIDGLVVATDNLSKGTLSLAEAYNKQTLRLDANVRAQNLMTREVKLADNAHRQELINLQQLSTRLDVLSSKYGLAAIEVSKYGNAIKTAATNSAQAINQRLGVTDTFASPARTQDIAAYGKALDDTRAKFNPLFAAGQQYKATLNEINQANKVGAISDKERLAAIETTKTAFVQQVNTLRGVAPAAKDAAKAIGLTSYETLNLSRQLADVGVSLQAGQSPFTVLVQQGTQIVDIMQTTRGSISGMFSQAIGWAGRFFTSTAGIVTGIAAIGVAAVYAASQFVRASTTIEQALEEQNRLLKEGKALIDARTSAEARAQLQSKEQTQFETLRNQLDLQMKLNQAMEEAAILSRRRATRPTEVPGEMGVAPTAFAALSDPGLDKMTAAFVALKEAQAAGLPGLKQYNAELAKIGLAHPELALIVQDMIKAGEAGLQLEFAAQRAKAMSDALAGIATNAQLAAVGLGSIAQFNLNNLMGEQAKEATERMAVATLQMAQAYPGMSIEVAKMLDGLSRQLVVAQAVGQMAQIEVQHRVRLVELSKTMTEAEATRVADAERAVSLAQIEVAHKQQMVTLQGQLSVAQQSTGIGQINAQYEATVALLTLQIGAVRAIAQAEMQRAISIAQVNANADQLLKTLQQEGELIRASSAAEEDRVKARQTYQKLVDQGVDSTKAQLVAGKQLQNSEAQRQKIYENMTTEQKHQADLSEMSDYNREQAIAKENQVAAAARAVANATAAAADEADRLQRNYEKAAAALKFLPMRVLDHMAATQGTDIYAGLYKKPDGTYSQFDPAGYTFTHPWAAAQAAGAFSNYGKGGFDETRDASGYFMVQPNLQGLEYQFNRSGQTIVDAIDNLISNSGNFGSPGIGSTDVGQQQIAMQMISRLSNLLPEDQKAGVIQRQLSALGTPTTLAGQELVKSLNDQLRQLTEATQENTSATSAMTDVLSPFYSSDPRRTHLGFRAFAGGGIMSQFGELPIRHYQGGGMATSPQVAVFGEGSTPEAYVPVPSGRIPVELKAPANSNDKQRPVTVTINVMGNADQGTVAALRSTAFQQAQAMRRVMA